MLYDTLNYKELKEVYSKRGLGCGEGYFGKIYNPKTTETHKIINPVTKYIENEGFWRDIKGDLCYGGYTVKNEKYKIEENVTQGNHMNKDSILFIRNLAIKNYMICGLNVDKKNKNGIEEFLKNENCTIYGVFGKNLKVQNPVILPFEEYLKQFVT